MLRAGWFPGWVNHRGARGDTTESGTKAQPVIVGCRGAGMSSRAWDGGGSLLSALPTLVWFPPHTEETDPRRESIALLLCPTLCAFLSQPVMV